MRGLFRVRQVVARGFLGRLARDVRGNTLAMMAAAMIPLAGLVGGGIDISRMYITKTRLQHACDAGALAGRKNMGGGSWGSDDNTVALQFFNANYTTGSYGSGNVTVSFTENAGKVTGTASTTLPLTLMKVFKLTSETLSVSCDAEMRLPNTDIMFVLDVTGSMASKAVSTDTLTKIESLRVSVKCFYEVVARLDTDANCTTGTPSGGTGNSVQIRFGFVPYSSNVNVGKLLPTAYFADSWQYQSREPTYTNSTTTTWAPSGSATFELEVDNRDNIDNEGWVTMSTGHASNSSNCDNLADPQDTDFTVTWEGSPYNQNTSGGNPRTKTWQTDVSGWYYRWRYDWGSFNGSNTCRLQRRKREFDGERNYSQQETGTQTVTQVFSGYRYARMAKNISGLKNGTSWNNSIQANVGNNGAMTTINWDGCIEERATVRATSYTPIPSGAKDLDIDLIPSSGDPDSLWGPVLPGLIFARNVTTDWNQASLAETTTTTNYYNNIPYNCPAEGRKLQQWTSPSSFSSYVDGLSPTGNTYHDIGMIWGARFISPTGIFAAENATTPTGGEIERHLIFMTDGEACTSAYNYTPYGVAWWDRRQTDASTAPTDGCNTTGTLTQQVNARLAALCTAVKNKNITLWVIWFGASNTTIETSLQSCATSGRFFTARDSAQLQTTFKNIADQISQLRLTR